MTIAQSPIIATDRPDDESSHATAQVADAVPISAAAYLLVGAAVLQAVCVVVGGMRIGVAQTIALTFTAAAGLLDGGTWRISNRLTYPLAIIGLFIALAGSLDLPPWAIEWLGAPALRESLLGVGVLAGVLLPCWILRLVGGGDMKLLIGLGAALGLANCLVALAWALPVAIVIALANVFTRGRAVRSMTAACDRLLPSSLRAMPGDDAPFKTRIPLGPAIFAGVVCLLIFKESWLGWVGP